MTVSVYCSPETVDPSPYARENFFFASLAVLLLEGLYLVCPEQEDPQLEDGRKRSLEPVSKSTEILLSEPQDRQYVNHTCRRKSSLVFRLECCLARALPARQ